MIRFGRLSHADLTAIVVLLDDRERRETLPTVGRLIRWRCRRELAKRERVTDEANVIYRG